MEALLPCPFCGTGPQLFDDGYIHWLGCVNNDCGIQPSVTKWAKTSVTAMIAAWNLRTPPPPGAAPKQGEAHE